MGPGFFVDRLERNQNRGRDRLSGEREGNGERASVKNTAVNKER